MALPAHCHHCIELEARLHRSENLIGQLLGQIRIAMANQRIAEAAVLEFLDPPPAGELRAV